MLANNKIFLLLPSVKNLSNHPSLKEKKTMLKIQLTHTPIRRPLAETSFGSENTSAKTDKSLLGLTHSGFKMHSGVTNYEAISHAVIKENDNVNILKKKTAKNVNFGGLPVSTAAKGLKATKTWKFAQSDLLHKFLKLADSNQTVFDALFALLITCGLRPAAIMAQANEHNKEKNKKAASHSISSGIIGYVFAVVIYSHIKKGLDKIRKNPEKYAQKAEKFFTYNGTKKMAASKRFQTFTMLCNYVPQVITASIRSAITIAMIPYIDKYILNKIFGAKTQPTTKEELKEDPTYKFAFINFKNNNSSNANKVFQNFTGVMK